jgi:predicted nucleic acid-binding protein
MSVLVDTSVWSMALRRDQPPPSRELDVLREAVERGDVCLLGVILQEVLQGFASAGGRTRRLVDHLSPFPLLPLERSDYVYASEIRNHCRTRGLAITTIDAQIASAAISHGCSLLTLDDDFGGVARHFPLRLA